MSVVRSGRRFREKSVVVKAATTLIKTKSWSWLFLWSLGSADCLNLVYHIYNLSEQQLDLVFCQVLLCWRYNRKSVTTTGSCKTQWKSEYTTGSQKTQKEVSKYNRKVGDTMKSVNTTGSQKTQKEVTKYKQQEVKKTQRQVRKHNRKSYNTAGIWKTWWQVRKHNRKSENTTGSQKTKQEVRKYKRKSENTTGSHIIQQEVGKHNDKSENTKGSRKTQQEVRKHNRKSENTTGSQKTQHSENKGAASDPMVLCGVDRFSYCNYFTWKSYKHVMWLCFCWKWNMSVRFPTQRFCSRRSRLWQQSIIWLLWDWMRSCHRRLWRWTPSLDSSSLKCTRKALWRTLWGLGVTVRHTKPPDCSASGWRGETGASINWVTEGKTAWGQLGWHPTSKSAR